jgi:hypothetical protein
MLVIPALLDYSNLQLPKSVVVFTSTDGLTPCIYYTTFSRNWYRSFGVFTQVLLKVIEANDQLSNLGFIQVSHDLVRDYVGQLAAESLKRGEPEEIIESILNNCPALICCSEKIHSSVFGNRKSVKGTTTC